MPAPSPAPGSPAPRPPSPDPIVRAAAGFMAAKQLFTASRIGLFQALAGGGLPVGELAARLGVPERSARILADAMTALGLLTHTGGRYHNGEAARAYLAGPGGLLDLRPYLEFWDTLSYPHWRAYDQAVRKGAPAPFDMSGDRQGIFFAGVGAFNHAHALMLAAHYDFGAHRRLLDLGGLSVAFLTCALEGHPGLRGTFLAPEPMLAAARATLHGTGEGADAGADGGAAAAGGAREGAGSGAGGGAGAGGGGGAAPADRIELVAGDPLTADLPTGFDAVLLEHAVHRYGAEDNRALLARARSAAAGGARLLVVDFFLDPDPAGRPLDALMAGEYLVVDGTVVYPEEEVRGWLAPTGWRWRETRVLPGSPRVMIADAV